MSESDSRQFVRVEFARGCSIAKGEPRYPWHWVLLIQCGHAYHISDSFATFSECMADFEAIGAPKIAGIEEEMRRGYSGADLNAINPEG